MTMGFIIVAACLYAVQGWNFKRLNRIRDELTPEEREAWIAEGRDGDSHPGEWDGD